MGATAALDGGSQPVPDPRNARAEGAPRQAKETKAGALVMLTPTGRAYTKRYFNEHWREDCDKVDAINAETAANGKNAEYVKTADLNFHENRGTAATLGSKGVPLLGSHLFHFTGVNWNSPIGLARPFQPQSVRQAALPRDQRGGVAARHTLADEE